MYMGGHTLVGRLSGIWTQSGIVAASKCATAYRHFGEAAAPAGACRPCPIFTSSYTPAFALQLRKITVKPQSWPDTLWPSICIWLGPWRRAEREPIQWSMMWYNHTTQYSRQTRPTHEQLDWLTFCPMPRSDPITSSITRLAHAPLCARDRVRYK